MVELRGVSFGYQSDKNVLDNLNLRLKEGRFYGLLGMNGSGKTTLLKLIAGKLFAHGGEIYVDGRNSRKREVETLREVFMLPADFIFPDMRLEHFLTIIPNSIPNFVQKCWMTVWPILKFGGILNIWINCRWERSTKWHSVLLYR